MKISRMSIVLSLFGASVLTMSGRAEALQTQCAVTKVAWALGGVAQVLCGGTWYYAFGSSSTCPVADIDSRKAWFSLAQSALLSGKQLYIEYSSCTGGPGLSYVQLVQ